MHLLHQLGGAKRGSGRQRITRILPDKLPIRANRPLRVVFLFRVLANFKKLGCVSVQLLFTGRDILCFLAGPKNDRRIARVG
jgi:hypothetical protein